MGPGWKGRRAGREGEVIGQSYRAFVGMGREGGMMDEGTGGKGCCLDFA